MVGRHRYRNPWSLVARRGLQATRTVWSEATVIAVLSTSPLLWEIWVRQTARLGWSRSRHRSPSWNSVDFWVVAASAGRVPDAEEIGVVARAGQGRAVSACSCRAGETVFQVRGAERGRLHLVRAPGRAALAGGDPDDVVVQRLQQRRSAAGLRLPGLATVDGQEQRGRTRRRSRSSRWRSGCGRRRGRCSSLHRQGR